MAGRDPNLIKQLTGQVQVTTKMLLFSNLTSESGVTSLLPEMVKKFDLSTVNLLHNSISYFYYYTWDMNMLIEEFVVGFHSSLDTSSKLDMYD